MTAHYDTQPNGIIPIVIGFSNWLSFLISNLVFVYIILVVVSLIGSIFGGGYFFVELILLYGFLFQMTYGYQNKHTANDNTSGVASLLNIMSTLPVVDRNKVCFVFFDDEEIGLVGSKAFKKCYREIFERTPLINFDCVGHGENLCFIGKKKFVESPVYKLLYDAADKHIHDSSKKMMFGSALKNVYTSDQLRFPISVGVVAAHRLPVFGYYLTRIHSSFDTRFDKENIDILTDVMISLIQKL